ncbi:MAG: antitoxin (DNA-binding transcriptional repressor) of toxin-antitoxin stability system [Candidatus Poriferisodalaceae bacterium]|jgi:antitoxin (DNA-binding transcriptional repressor) of toxin-antitoxin stability system
MPATDQTASRQIGTRELRSNLAAHLRAAEAGETIVITVDGHPVAELGPVGGASRPTTVDDLIASGLVQPPRRTDRPAGPPPTPLPAGMNSDRLLMELRGR